MLGGASARAVVLRYEQSPGTTTGWVTAVNLPDDLASIRGLVIVGNGAGADETGAVNDPELLAFARAHGFGVLAFGRWGNLYTAGERSRFLAALADFAARANRPELVNVPWVAFGFSQGGGQAYSLNYHFSARTLALGVNKAGFSYLNGGSDTGRLDATGVGGRAASPEALKTPALLVAGALDDSGRITNLTHAFTNNRGQNAPWAMLIEEGVGHEKGRATHWMLPFLAEAIALRYPASLGAASGAPALLDVNQASGWLLDRATQASGELAVQAQSAFAGTDAQRLALGWVPGEATARRAQAFGSFQKITGISSATTTASPSAAPLDLVYAADLAAQTSPAWTRVEFFDGAGKLGELLPAAGPTPTWTRRIASGTGFVSTHGLVTRADGTRRYTPLQTLWLNGGSGFALPEGAAQAVWSSAVNASLATPTAWTSGAAPAFGADAWVGLRNTSTGAITVNLDGARTLGYLQNLTGNYVVVAGGTGGSLTFATGGNRSAALQLGAGGTFEFRLAPSGSAPLELIGNGNPSTPGTVIMNVASGYSGALTARHALRWDMAVSATAFGTAAAGTSIEAGSVLNFREWPSGSIFVAEPFTFAGLGQPGLPALRVGTANNSTVTLTGPLTLNSPVALGAASSANGIHFTLNGPITSLPATDRSLYLGYLQSQAGDATLPGGTSLNTTGLDDAGGVWGATTLGGNVNYPGLAPDRVVLGLGDFRLIGANHRLPVGARLVFNTAAATPTAALRQSRLTLGGIAQEVAGLDSYAGANTAYAIALVGGSATPSVLVVNTPAFAASTYAGALGGAGANENALSLEKRGAGTLTLTGALTYTGPTLVSGGTLALGAAVGALGTSGLTVEAGATLSAADALTLPAATTLRRSAAGGGATVQVAGALTLGGALTVELPGYAPVVGDLIPLLSAGSLSGAFASVSIPRTVSGPAYRLEITATQVRLRVVGASFDTALFRAGLLSASAPVPASAATADTDADGLPDLLDYVLGGSLSAAAPAPFADHAGGRLRLRFTRDTRATDVTLQVEAAAALAADAWAVVAENVRGAGWTGAAAVAEAAPDASGRASVTVADPLAGSPRFLRLRALYQP